MNVASIRPFMPPQEPAPARESARPASTPFDRVRAEAQRAAGAPRDRDPEQQAPVTAEERDYFEHLFPAASAEIRSYPTYSPSGLKTLQVSGTMIDRKG